MEKRELDIIALHHSVGQNPNYALVLGEVNGNRRLLIVIGATEAQAIVVEIEDMKPNRPLTHDLLKNALETFEIELREIVISNVLEGIFYARLICERDGDVFEIDSRTSDAVALAVRFNCPIYTYEKILEEAGIVYEQEDTPEGQVHSRKRRTPENIPTEKLEEMLKGYLDDENYEQAAKIRDEIKKREDDNMEDN